MPKKLTITILATLPDGMFSEASALGKINEALDRMRKTLAEVDQKATIEVADDAGRKG